MAPKAQGTLIRPPHPERISALGVVAPPPIAIESPHFSGSLATLFQCVHDHKVDLLLVPLFPICRAYFEYLLTLENRDLDEAGAALMALAYLLERKAWALLPSPDPEPEPDDMALVLPTAHEYAMAIEALKLWQQERDRFFFRSLDNGPDPYELPFTMGDVTSNDLARALERLLMRASPEPVQPLNKPRKSLSEQMHVVFSALSSQFRALEDLVPTPFTREEAVYWFLALLELIRLSQAQVRVEGDDVLFARGTSG